MHLSKLSTGQCRIIMSPNIAYPFILLDKTDSERLGSQHRCQKMGQAICLTWIVEAGLWVCAQHHAKSANKLQGDTRFDHRSHHLSRMSGSSDLEIKKCHA